MLLSHTFSKEDYGQFTILILITGLLQLASGLSLHEGALRTASQSNSQINKKNIFSSRFVVSTSLSILVVITTILAISFFNDGLQNRWHYFILLMPLFNQFFLFSCNYSRAIGLNSLYGLLLILPPSFSLSTAILLNFKIINNNQFVILYSLSYVLPLLALLAIRKSSLFIKRSDGTPKKIGKEEFNYGISASLSMVISQLTLNSDSFMIAYTLGNEYAAEYRNGTLIAVSLLFIPSVYTGFFYVRLSRANNVETIFDIYKKIMMRAIPLATAICLTLYFYSEEIINSFFGEKYVSSSSEVLQIMSILIFVSFVFRVPLGNILNARGLTRFNLYNSIITLFINITLNYFFIPIYGLTGAAMVTVVSIMFSSLFSILYFNKHIKALKINKVNAFT